MAEEWGGKGADADKYPAALDIAHASDCDRVRVNSFMQMAAMQMAARLESEFDQIKCARR